MTTEIEKFKLETARQVVAAIRENQPECYFTLIEMDDQEQINDAKRKVLSKAEIVLDKAGIKVNLLIINICPVAPDEPA
jgi:hypothetical protein